MLGSTPRIPATWKRCSIVLILLLTTTLIFLCIRSLPHWPIVSPHVVVIDCGSSGSRIHAYRLEQRSKGPTGMPKLRALPPSAAASHVPQRAAGMIYSRMEVNPGLADAFAAGTPVSKVLEPLLGWAAAAIPRACHRRTIVLLFGTAGLRKMQPEDQARLLTHIRSALRKSPFVFRDAWANVLDGPWEGVFSWLAVNYSHRRLPGMERSHHHAGHASNHSSVQASPRGLLQSSAGGPGCDPAHDSDAVAAATMDQHGQWRGTQRAGATMQASSQGAGPCVCGRLAGGCGRVSEEGEEEQRAGGRTLSAKNLRQRSCEGVKALSLLATLDLGGSSLEVAVPDLTRIGAGCPDRGAQHSGRKRPPRPPGRALKTWHEQSGLWPPLAPGHEGSWDWGAPWFNDWDTITIEPRGQRAVPQSPGAAGPVGAHGGAHASEALQGHAESRGSVGGVGRRRLAGWGNWILARRWGTGRAGQVGTMDSMTNLLSEPGVGSSHVAGGDGSVRPCGGWHSVDVTIGGSTVGVATASECQLGMNEALDRSISMLQRLRDTADGSVDAGAGAGEVEQAVKMEGVSNTSYAGTVPAGDTYTHVSQPGSLHRGRAPQLGADGRRGGHRQASQRTANVQAGVIQGRRHRALQQSRTEPSDSGAEGAVLEGATRSLWQLEPVAGAGSRNLQETSLQSGQQTIILDHPCLPAGFDAEVQPKKGQRVAFGVTPGTQLWLRGTGGSADAFYSCRKLVQRVISAEGQLCGSEGTCEPPLETPRGTFFVGLAGFYVVFKHFGLVGENATLSNLATATRRECGQPFSELQALYGSEIYLETYCFRGMLVMELLEYFNVDAGALLVDNGSTSWTLGAALYYSKFALQRAKAISELALVTPSFALIMMAVLCLAVVVLYPFICMPSAPRGIDDADGSQVTGRLQRGLRHTFSMLRLSVGMLPAFARRNNSSPKSSELSPVSSPPRAVGPSWGSGMQHKRIPSRNKICDM